MKQLRWIKIAASEQELLSQLNKGHVTTIIVEGKKICLGKSTEGFFAVSDRCPHAGGSLGHGWFSEDGDLICPLHRMSYDPRSGRNTSGDGFYVEPYPVKLSKEGVFIGLSSRNWWAFW